MMYNAAKIKNVAFQIVRASLQNASFEKKHSKLC